MGIDDILNFGKYSGLTVREVYQGIEKPSESLIRGYMLHRILYNNPDESGHYVSDMVNFEISKTLLRAVPILPDFKGNLSKEIEKVLCNGSSKLDNALKLSTSLTTLDYYNIEVYSKNLEKPELAGGIPDYISWCIRNVKSFFVDPEAIYILEDLDVFKFKGIRVIHKIEDIYEYKPIMGICKGKFDKMTIDLNSKKAELFFCKRRTSANEYDSYTQSTDWTHYNDDVDMDQQDLEFWNQF